MIIEITADIVVAVIAVALVVIALLLFMVLMALRVVAATVQHEIGELRKKIPRFGGGGGGGDAAPGGLGAIIEGVSGLFGGGK